MCKIYYSLSDNFVALKINDDLWRLYTPKKTQDSSKYKEMDNINFQCLTRTFEGPFIKYDGENLDEIFYKVFIYNKTNKMIYLISGTEENDDLDLKSTVIKSITPEILINLRTAVLEISSLNLENYTRIQCNNHSKTFVRDQDFDDYETFLEKALIETKRIIGIYNDVLEIRNIYQEALEILEH